MSNNPLTEVLVLSEAAALVGLTEAALRYYIRVGRFKEGVDYKRSGRIIIVLKSAVEREWGRGK